MAQRPAGLLITPTLGEDPKLVREARRRTPIVAIDELPTGMSLDTVTFDNLHGAQNGVATAVALGCRSIITISAGTQLSTMAPRAQGAARALAASGLPVTPTHDLRGPDTRISAKSLAVALLAADPSPDAIFCTNNVVALGVAEAVVEARANVAIISFDDFALSSAMPVPVIVIDHDTRELGRTAAALLFARLDAPARPLEHLTVPTTIRLTGGVSR